MKTKLAKAPKSPNYRQAYYEKNKARFRAYYEANKEKILAYARAYRYGTSAIYAKRRADNRAFFIKKLGGKCQLCGYKKSRVALDFDHIDPALKEAEITSLMSTKNRDRIWVEVQKCRLLCANCHRIETMKLGHNGVKRTRA